MTSTNTTKSTKQRKGSSAIDKNNRQNPRKAPLNRPKTRNISRWSDALDNRLLLCIQSACNARGIKLPWEAVAELMGGYISAGAITQHLTKLRAKLVKEGQPVPPRLKRGGTSAGEGEGADATNRRKRSTAVNKKVRFEVSSDDDDDSDDSNSDSMAVAACLINTHKYKPNNAQKNEDVHINADIDNDNCSESSTEYVAVGASFLQFPNDPSSPLPPSYKHDHSYEAQCQPKGNARGKAKCNASAQSNANTSSSGSSPQRKLVKLRIATRGSASCDGNRAVGDNGIGGNSNGNAVGRRLSSEYTGSTSSHTAHDSPESACTVEMNAGTDAEGMAHCTGTVRQLNQQHYHHGQSPYGWHGSNGGSPHIRPAEMLRQLGHHVEYPNHGHNNLMARAGFQQGCRSFAMNPNGLGGLHNAASPYQDNTHIFRNGAMPSNSPPLPIPIPIHVQGGYSADGMWNNYRNNNLFPNIPRTHRTNITCDQRPHHTTHNHNRDYNRASYTPTTASLALPYQHSMGTEPRTVGRIDIENPPAEPTTLVEHVQIPDHQQEQQPHEQGQTLGAAGVEAQAAITDGLDDLPELNNFDAEFVHLDEGHFEGLLGAYGYEIEGVV
ncbi:hypothetical protein GX51_02587 [Blastomyces parvus]|uniref:Myb-like domain-containing protein n=1 Tax=Blastomyces parvus TaxID=2060905 RepID=A0A2B7XA68_9EURO|nr:hypothetical protein GX51_02587 [Blastomyces parvus]